jgi:uncharacterized protein (DUF736 family)
MSEEIIWVNLVPNENKSADNHPDWVAPPNPNAPEGKKWTIGTKIGETWHNPAGWNAKDMMLRKVEIRGLQKHLFLVINQNTGFN